MLRPNKVHASHHFEEDAAERSAEGSQMVAAADFLGKCCSCCCYGPSFRTRQRTDGALRALLR